MIPKPLLVAALAGPALVAALFAPPSSNGQAAPDEPVMTAVLAEVVAQQAVLAESQAKIDARLAVIGENLRLARIYVGRGGGKVP